MRRFLILVISIIMIIVTGCSDRGLTPDDLPTPASREAVGTSVALTRIAPPRGFNEFVSFPAIDDRLPVVSNWQYELTLRFSGVFTGTTRPAEGVTTMNAWYDLVGQRQRVVIERSGNLLTSEDETTVQSEGVRIIDNTFLVQDNVCVAQNTEDAEALADLRASDFIGGVDRATPAGAPERINGEEVWPYAVALEQIIRPPALDEGTVTGFQAELWVAPEHDAVIRYYVTLNIENAIIFNSSAPLTGTVTILYDLTNIGVDPNITRPFGC